MTSMLEFIHYYYTVIAIIIGCCVGSFINVVIYRLPIIIFTRGEAGNFSLSFPGSRCPTCKNKVYKRDNIPILSWLILKGKCRHCHCPISKLYPLSEFIFGFFFGLVIFYYYFDRELATLVMFLGLCSVCYVIFFIDLKWLIIPDELNYLLIWLGLLSSVMSWTNITPLQSVTSCMLVWSVIKIVIWGFKLSTGKDGLGDGDAKLFAAGATFIGLFAIPWLILLSVLFGLLTYLVVRSVNYRPDRGEFSEYYDIDEKSYIPFGPAICLAIMVLVFYFHIMM